MRRSLETRALGITLRAVAVGCALLVSGGFGNAHAAAITWNIAGSGAWDTTTGNWTGGSPVASKYVDSGVDSATFNNIAGGTITIQAGGVTPMAITVSAASGTYTFTGGPIKGGSLSKSGGGTLVLGGANTYGGMTTVSAGTLKLGTGANLGSYLLTVSGTGSFDLNGNNVSVGAGWPNDSSAITSTSADAITNNSLTPATFSFQDNGAAIPGGFSGLLSVNLTNNGNTNFNVTGPFTNTGNVTFYNTGINPITVSGSVNNIGTVTNSSGGQPTTISGVIGTNVTGVTQNGAGTMVLTNVNLYTAATTATAGTLQADFSAGVLSSDIINSASPLVLNGGTFSVKGRASATVSQTLSGLTLNAATSSGITLNNSGTATSLLFTNTTWTPNANSALLVDISAGGTLPKPANALTNSIYPWMIVKDATSTSFGTNDGTNVVRYTGVTTLTDVATTATTNYKLGGNLTLTAGPGTSRPMNSLELSAGGTLAIPATVVVSPPVILTAAGYTISGAGQIGGTNSNLALNVTSGNTLTLSAAMSGGSASLTKLGSGTLFILGTKTFTGDTVIAGGTLQLGGNGNGGGNISSTNIINNGVINLQDNADLTLVGNISGTGSITRTSTWSSIWTLSGNSDYSGGTSLNQSNTVITSNTALGSTEAGTAVGRATGSNTDAALGFDGSAGDLTSIAEPLWIGGTGNGNTPAAWSSGTGVLRNVAGNNTLSGPVTLTNASTVWSAAGSLKFAGGLALSTNALTFDGPAGNTIASTVTGSGGIVKNGSGTLQLNSVAASLAGVPVTQNVGTVSVDNAGAGGATATSIGAYTFGGDGAVLQTKQTVAQDVRVTLASVSRTAATAGYINNALAGTPSATNGVVVTGAAGVVNQGIFLGTSSSATDFAYADNTSSFIRAANYGVDAGTAAIGSAVADLSGNNEYLISAGGSVSGAGTQAIKTLKFTGGGSLTLGSGATLTLNTPGFLAAGGGTSTISGGTALTPASNKEVVVRADTASDILVINTPITGSTGGLFKIGAGTLTLGGSNTYTGTLTINAGTMNLNGSGTQTNTTVNNASILNLNAANAITTGALTLNGNSTLNLNAANAITAGTLTLNGTSTMTQTVDNAISGSAAVTINTPAGTVTLANANSYTGTTTLNNGILVISNNTALGTAAGVTRVNPNNSANAATLELTGNITIAETIRLPQAQGVGSLAPLVNLSGTNTITGTLGMGNGGGSGNIQSNPGSKLIIAGTVDGSGTGGGAVGLSFNGNGDYEISGSGTISAAIANGWSKTGSGTLTLFNANSHGGSVSINGGTVNIRTASALSTGSVSANGGTLALQLSGSNTITNSIANNGGILQNVSGDNTLTSFSWNAGGTRVKTDSGSLTIKGVAQGGNGHFDITFGGAANTTVAGALLWNAGGGQGWGITKTDPGTLTLAGASNNGTQGYGVTLSAGTLALFAAPSLIDSGASGSSGVSTLTVTSPTTPTLVIGQGVTGTGVAAGAYITAINTGTNVVTLSAANTGAVSGATFAAWSSINNTVDPLTLTNGTLTLTGATSGASNQTFANTTTINAGSSAISIKPNGGTGTSLTLGSSWSRSAGGTLNVDLSAGTGTSAVLASAPVAAGAQSATSNILGYTSVTDSTGTGFATVVGGNVVRYLSTANATALPASASAAGTNYRLSGTSTGLTLTAPESVNSLSIDTSTESSAGILSLGGQTLTLSQKAILMSGTGDFTIQNGQLGANASEVILHQYGTGTLTISGTISSGAGQLTLAGTGLTVLTGTNAYTGATNLNGGILRATSGTGLPTSSLLYLNNGVFETNANVVRALGSAAGNVQVVAGNSGFSANGGPVTVAIGGLATPTALTWGSASFNPTSLILNASTANDVLTFANAIDLNGSPRTINTYAGSAVLSGAITSSGVGGALTKGGAGQLTLAGANAYAGPTSISAGKFYVDGSLASASVNVASNATLGGVGTITAPVVLATGGAITSANSLTVGGLTFNDSAFTWQIAGGGTPVASHLQVNGDLTFSGTPTLRLTNVDGTTPGGTWVLMNYSGTLSSQPAWSFDYSAASSSTISHWIDGTGNWDTVTNWDGQGWSGGTVTYDTANKQLILSGVTTGAAMAPGSATDVVIAPANNAAVTGPVAPLTIASLTLGNASANSHALTLQAGGPLNVTGTVTVNATGSLNASAAALTAAQLTLNGAASATLGAATVPTIGVGSAATLNLQGNLGTATTALSTAGTTSFNSGATGTLGALNVTAGTTTVNSGATPTFTSVTVAGAGNFTAAGGTITGLTVQSGYSGAVNINAGTTLGGSVTLPSGTFNYNNPGTLASLAVNGGSATLSGGATVSSATVAASGNLTASNSTINGLTLQAGYAGTVTINSTATLNGSVTVPSGTVNLNNTNTMSSLTATGGTVNTGAGVTVTTATLTGGGSGAAVNTQGNYLNVTNTITLKPTAGDITATYSGPAGSFGIQGGDLANTPTGLLLSTAGGKVTLTQQVGGYVAGLRNGFVAGPTEASLYPTTTVQELDLHRVQVAASSSGAAGNGWSDNQTIVYTGQMNFAGTAVNFAENFDDYTVVKVKVNGVWQTLINNNTWNDVTTNNGVVTTSYVSSSGVLTLPASGWYDVEFRFGQGGGGIGANQSPWSSAPIMAFGYDSQGRATTTKANYAVPADDGTMNLFRFGSVVAGPMNLPTTAVTASATSELALPTGANTLGALTLSGTGTQLTLTGATTVTFNGDVTASGTPSVALSGPSMIVTGNVTTTNPTDVLTLPAISFAANTVNINSSGPGKVVFSGATTFTSPGASLLINAGRLQVDQSLNNVSVTVNNGGILGGTGSVLGSVMVSAGGALAPGDSPGKFTVTGAYTQDANALLLLELSGHSQGVDYDWLSVSGTATLDGTLSVDAIGPWFLDYGDTFTVLTAGAITNNGIALGGPDAQWFSMNVGTNSIVLTSLIPEPASLALLGLAMLFVGGRRRRSGQSTRA